MSRRWSEQVRITCWAWLATLGAAVMISPLVQRQTYLVYGAAGAAMVMLLGAALRVRRFPGLPIVLLQVVATAELVLVVYAPSAMLLRVVPTPAAVVRIADRVGHFINVTQQYAAPVPRDADLTMTLSVLVVLLAIVVDAVAVTWRRVPLLGLVFLAIYMVPVADLGGQVNPFTFAAGAAGFVFLLAADERERLTHWGRQISTPGSPVDDPAEEVNSGGIRTTGRRLGLGAVAAAVVLPVVVPTLSPHYFGTSSSGGDDGTGSGRTLVTNPVLDLKRNLTGQGDDVLLTFTTDQPDPGYLRLASLNEFTGSVWQPGARDPADGVSSDAELPDVPGVTSTVSRAGYRYDVAVSNNLVSRWLPLVYAPTTIDATSRWNVDETTLDAVATEDGQSTAGEEYTFTAAIPEPGAALLRSAGRPPTALSSFTDLPGGVPPAITEQALRVTADAATPFDQAEALQSWFRTEGGFRYSLAAAPGNGLQTIEAFVTTDRVGYCEQFASAMAMMARSLDIPARVAVGFLHPQQIGAQTYVYRGTDMHSWPELYFAGTGWVRFEPTPATRTGPAPHYGNAAETVGPTKTTSTKGQGKVPDDPSRPVDTVAAATGNSAGGSGPFHGTALFGELLAAGGLLACLPAAVRAWDRRRRWRGSDTPAAVAEAAWAELRDSILDLRMRWDDTATPRGAGRQLRASLPQQATVVPALNRIVIAVEQARYARSVDDTAALRDAVGTVVTAAGSTRPAATRFFAKMFPASLLRRRNQRAPQTSDDAVRERLVTVGH